MVAHGNQCVTKWENVRVFHSIYEKRPSVSVPLCSLTFSLPSRKMHDNGTIYTPHFTAVF